MPARRRGGAAIPRPRIPESRFGAILRAEREQARLSQQDLADAIGTSQFRMSHFEANVHEPTIGEVVAMEAVLGLRPGTLLVRAGYVELPERDESLPDRIFREDGLSREIKRAVVLLIEQGKVGYAALQAASAEDRLAALTHEPLSRPQNNEGAH